jgi:integrase
MTKAMKRAIEAARRVLHRIGADEIYIAKVLSDLGLDEDNDKRTPIAATVRNMDEVAAACPGIYRVASNGVKRLHLKKTSLTTGSWFVRWRTPKDELAAALAAGKKMRKRPEIGLGSIKDVPLAKAIQLAGQINAGLDGEVSVNPRDVRATQFAEIARRAEADKAEAALPTVAEVAGKYVHAKTHGAKKWKGGTHAANNWLNPLKTHAFPIIGDLKVNAVEPKDIVKVLSDMDDKGLATAKVRSSLKTLFKWMIEKGIRDSRLGNPADVAPLGRSGKHYDCVKPDKAPGVFRQLLAAAPGNIPMSCWVFMALTAARPSEALAARWDQIDRDAKGGPVWNNPAPKTGRTEPLVVPLTATALAILDERLSRAGGDLAKLAESKALVFAGKGGGKIAHSNFAGGPERAGIDAATPHGWRSVCSDALSEHCHISREVREAVLGHALPATEGAYRRSDGLKARTTAMQRYEKWLLSGEDQGGKVVDLQNAA